MIKFCRKLMREIRSVTSIPQFTMTYEETNSNTFFLKKPCTTAVQRERMIFKSGNDIILAAEKEGKRRIYVSRISTSSEIVMDEIGFRERFEGTPFSEVKRAVSFEDFNAFVLWFVSGGYYFKKTSKPIRLDQIADLDLFYPPVVIESMHLGTGNLENAP
jgi:hypothetical protein